MRFGLYLSCAILISSSSFSQFLYGVKTGLNFSKTVYNNLPANFTYSNEPEWISGLHVGIYGSVKLSNKLSLIPELQFSQRGYKVTYAATNSGSSSRITYLELPILLSYYLKRFGIDFGPNVSYKLSSTLSNAFKDFDFGLEGGLRACLTKNLFITARYYYGIAAISEIIFFDLSGRTLGTVTEHNRAIQFGLGYKIK